MMMFLKISAYLAPIILVIWSVFNRGVNVPFWDDWDLVSLFDKVKAGTVTFNDFFALHNEHRMFFPKFIFVVLAFPSKWNLKLEMYFSVLLAAITFYLIYVIAKSRQEKPRKFFDLFNMKNSKITLRGWATLRESKQLPELVLFSYDNQQSFFANAEAIPKKSRKEVYWSGTFLVKGIPPGEHLIAAWVYDRNGKQFVKLDGEVKVKIAA